MSSLSIRPAKAMALAMTIQALSGQENVDTVRLGQVRKALLQLVRAHTTDGEIVRAAVGCLERWIDGLMREHDLAALHELLGDVGVVARQYSRDEDLVLKIARVLVTAAITWKDLQQREFSGRSIVTRLLETFSRGGDPVLEDLKTALQTAVTVCPFADRLADARRRFEGLTGFKLRTTRPTTSVPRLALKPAH